MSEPVRQALIVVDVQRGFVTPGTEGTSPLILDHLRRWPDRYDVVIATRFVNEPGSFYATQRDWHAMMDAPDTDVLPAIEAVADVIVTKHGLAPRRDDVMPILRRHAIERVEICGFDTDQCVLATALLLWDAGIVPRVLAGLSASSGGPEMHEAGLAITRRAIGDRNVVDTRGRAI